MEDFVSFLLAKKLKEKGFTLPKSNVVGKFDSDGVFHSQLYINFTETMDSEEIIAPTISQVLKWLREEKKMFVQISLFQYCYDYCILDTEMVYYDNEHKVLHQGPTGYSYNEAALAGIEYVLDNNLI